MSRRTSPAKEAPVPATAAVADAPPTADPIVVAPPAAPAAPLAVVEAQLPPLAATEDPYGADAIEDALEVDRRELLVPFVGVLQKGSPQCDEAHASYDPQARPGMIVNGATGEYFDGKVGAVFVPVKKEHAYVEWVTRNAGGGFVGVWEDTDPRLPALLKQHGEYGKLPLESGNELIETYSLYGLFVPLLTAEDPLDSWDDSRVDRVIISFSSTQIRAYRSLITRLAGVVGQPRPRFPIYAFAWHLRTVAQKNKKGSWHGWASGFLGGSSATAQLPPTSPTYQAARDFARLLREGGVKASYEQGSGDAPDEDVPF